MSRPKSKAPKAAPKARAKPPKARPTSPRSKPPRQAEEAVAPDTDTSNGG